MQKRIYVLFALFAVLAGPSRAAARNLALSWNPSTDSDVAGYNIYYGTSAGNYTNKVTVGNTTTATVSNLIAGATYYFTATAYNSAGVESDFSNETSFIVPGTLKLTPGVNVGDAPLIRFPVEPGHWYEVQATSDLQSWTTISQTDVATANEWVQYSDPDAAAFSSRFYRLVMH